MRLELNLHTFVETAFLPYLCRAEQAAVHFTTMAELGDTVTARRQLYLLNMACSADIPCRGRFETFTEYLDQRIEVDTYDPHGVILAVHGHQWVGMASTSLRPSFGVSEMTGVLASWRGHGLSVAMSVLAIRYIRSHGRKVLRSAHHPANLAAIEMNRRLGFTDSVTPLAPTRH